VHDELRRPFVRRSLTKEFAAASVAALQRHEGWRRPHGTPRGGPHALSWGSVALQGLESNRDRTAMGSVRPARRFHAHRVHSRPDLRPAEADRGPSCAFAPLQRSISAAPRRAARPVRPAPDASSPELLCPTAPSKSGGPVGWQRIPPPPRATSGVWLPPSRRPPPPLPAHEAPEHPWASPFEA
jgi:hypothetical protein